MQAIPSTGDDGWRLLSTLGLHFLPPTLDDHDETHDGRYLSETTYPFLPLQTGVHAPIPFLQAPTHPRWRWAHHPGLPGAGRLDARPFLPFQSPGLGVACDNELADTHDSAQDTGPTMLGMVLGETAELHGAHDAPVSAGTRLAEEYLCFPLSATSGPRAGNGGSEVGSVVDGNDEREEGEEGESPDRVLFGETSDQWDCLVRGWAGKDDSNSVHDGRSGDALAREPWRDWSLPQVSGGAGTTGRPAVPLSSDATAAVLALTDRYLQDMSWILGTSVAPPRPSQCIVAPDGDSSDRLLADLTRLCNELAARLHASNAGDATQPGQSRSNGTKGTDGTDGTEGTEDGADAVPALRPPPFPTFVRYAHGQWKQDELDLLRLLITTSRGIHAQKHSASIRQVDAGAGARPHPPRDKRNRDDGVDWHWVCQEMVRAGTVRSRHQVLCKAVEIGLKKPLIRRGKKRKRQVSEETTTES